MKHMGKVHILKYILLLIVAIGVGIGGYEIGVTHSQNQKAYQVVQSKKANQNPVSDKKTNSVVNNTNNKDIDSDNEYSSSNTKSIETYSCNINNYYNSDSDTFMGCKSLSDFYSKYGETPCSYLLDKGFTKDEIFSIMKQIPNYHQWMTSSEIQTMNEDNN